MIRLWVQERQEELRIDWEDDSSDTMSLTIDTEFNSLVSELEEGIVTRRYRIVVVLSLRLSVERNLKSLEPS